MGEGYKQRIEEALEILTVDKLKEILYTAGAEIISETSEYLILNTICHSGNSHKLYYYKENKAFMCYTSCGFMSMIDFLMKIWSCDFFRAIEILRQKVGLATRGFGNKKNSNLKQEIEETKNFLSSFATKSRNEVELKAINPVVLERYEDKYKLEWLMDNISSEAMKEFNIKYCYTGDKIIIPHYDINNRLVGIRSRNFGEEIEKHMKYTPLFVENKMYNHPLGFNLYGLNKNKDNIKRRKCIVLVEAEKGVLQAETYYGRENNITVAVCGSNLSKFQRDIILKLGVERIYIGFDRQWEKKGTEEYERWVSKIEKIVNMFSMFVEVYIIWDDNNLLDYKDSPYDKGYYIAQELFSTAYRDIMSFKEYQYKNEIKGEVKYLEKSIKAEKFLLSAGLEK